MNLQFYMKFGTLKFTQHLRNHDTYSVGLQQGLSIFTVPSSGSCQFCVNCYTFLVDF